MKRNKGFTLIELLVVIAIIGILSAIVLASLSSARGKAQDAKIQSQLAGMRAAAEIYLSSHSNKYSPVTAVCTTDPSLFTDPASGMNALVTGTTVMGGTVNCDASDNAWAVSASLISTTTAFWCVDSTGKSLQVSGNPGVVSVCPAS